MTDRLTAAEPPGWIQGIWRRHGRLLSTGSGNTSGGGAHLEETEEVSDVLWIQAGAYFADVRVARPGIGSWSELDQTQAFSGHVTFDCPVVTWHHELDTIGRPPGYEDRADVEAYGADQLCERAPGYVEFWRRVCEPDTGTAVLEKRDRRTGAIAARVIQSGDVVACVWAGMEPGGAALRHEGGGWDVIALVGPDSIPWTAVTAAARGPAPAGWHRVA